MPGHAQGRDCRDGQDGDRRHRHRGEPRRDAGAGVYRSRGLPQPHPGVRPRRRDDDGVDRVKRGGHGLSGPCRQPRGGRDSLLGGSPAVPFDRAGEDGNEHDRPVPDPL